jgi:2-polyprenyl-3-methyl-5-hydroxy-6-metoxy-1,4-benzoquinol methylase
VTERAVGSATVSAVPLEVLIPLMRAKGVKIAPADFHATVNLVFHKFESRHYDRIHRNMWESLPRQFGLLVDDYLRRHLPKTGLSVLDVGCGTGLSSELLTQTRLGSYIGTIDLVDTSPEMLDVCRRRRSRVARRLIRGTIDDVAASPEYDVVLSCSVLHHIPELARFTRAIAARQKPGGVFLHLQDPNADYHDDVALRRRVAELRASGGGRVARVLKRVRPARLAAAALHRVAGIGHRGYIDQINHHLLRAGIVQERLTAAELWSITDLHEHHGRGISISEMARLLPEYDLVSSRSYAFWGELESDLPRRFRRTERELSEQRSPEGSRVGALWIQKGNLPVS